MTDFKKTWKSLGIDLPDFIQWVDSQQLKFSSEAAAMLSYLSWLYVQRESFISKSLIGDTCPFAKEVRLACDQISVTGDTSYAERFIRGERLASEIMND